ncbi:MAG: S-layer homology domain-containing protein [Clostridiales Family XIII bacterium]|nr:S-layer homology domain-containing protein [Clostridiales Family XIII bacterium]
MRKRIKKAAALLLAALLAITTQGGSAFASLLPLETEGSLSLDLTAYPLFELSDFPVAVLLEKLDIDSDLETIAWVKKSYQSDDKDDFRIAQRDGTIDLYPENSYSSEYWLELIVGTGAQLDAGNKRYLIDVTVGGYDGLYDFALYAQDDDTREEVSIVGLRHSESESRYDISVPATRAYDAEYYLGLSLGSDLQNAGYDVTVYRGQYETAAEAAASGEDVTADVWDQNMTVRDAGLKDAYYWSKHNGFTAVFKKNGTVVGADSFWLNVEPATSSAYVAGIWSSGDSSREYASYDSNSEYDDDLPGEITTFKLYKEYPASASYYVSLVCTHNHEQSTADEYVKKAVVGHYDTEEEADAAEDIKGLLFPDEPWSSSSSGGHLANYGGAGVDFTVFFTDGSEPDKLTVKAVNGTMSRAAANPYNPDIYFDVQNGVYDNTNTGTYFNTYRVSPNDDSYYANGYQTLLVSGAAIDLTAVKPSFTAGEKIDVRANGEKQESGKSAQDFSNGAVPYSAFPEDSQTTALKNYRVSVVKQETNGAKLFVNGPSGVESSEKSDENTRELFLTDLYENRHDIFIANVGDAELKGLNVKLEDAQNVKLDEYWTVGGDRNTTLAAFTTTYVNTSPVYNKLPNIAKIRLLPDGDGTVSGKLTISAEGQESRVVYLTGIAGNPKILTQGISKAVKFVPYSFLLQTNSMYDWTDVSFSQISGRLPNGVTLRPNGEVYGVPTEAGSFSFTVRASFTPTSGAPEDLDFTPVEADFTLEVLDNTDANVDASTDPGYAISQRVPQTIATLQDYVFESIGEFGFFVDFWIDGDKLTGGDVDYMAEDGSTLITIRAQTFRRYGGGTHTIAAEFREGEDDSGELKRAAQNYTLDWSGDNSNSGGSGGTTPTEPAAATQPAQDGAAAAPASLADSFTDIRGHWAESYIRTVVERELFNGVSATRFDPDGTLSRAMLVTVLWRLAGRPAPGGGASFSDAGAGVWYSDAIGWAAENGIVLGNPDGSFGTGDDISREQIVTILFRYAERAEMDVSGRTELGGFPDAGALPAWGADAMSWAVNAGLIRGRDDGSLSPTDGATRAELATILVRFLDLADASGV